MNYLIIGAGPAGITAAEELRKRDSSASITVLSHEPEPPYSRMAIPYLIKKSIKEQGTHLRKSESHFRDLNIDLQTGVVASIDSAAKTVILGGEQAGEGNVLAFDRLLIASGGTPLTPPIEGIDLAGVYPCWNLDNARQIIARAVPCSKVVLIGAGFISTTIVEALVMSGAKLTILEMEDRLIPRMMDKKGADIIRSWCEEKGVSIVTSARVEKIEEGEGDGLLVSIAGQDADKPIEADLVISATGVKPNIAFLEGSGIETNLGVLVDEYLTTSDPNIYAAGDVAEAPDLLTDQKTVMAIQPVAAEHGRLAAINMLTSNTVEWRGSINMNVLDMLGLVSCSFGLWNGRQESREGQTVEDTAQLHQPDQHKYIQLQFDDDSLIGASSVGYTQHIGVFQGLIQGKVKLGEWKQKLVADPSQIMEAWIACTQGSR